MKRLVTVLLLVMVVQSAIAQKKIFEGVFAPTESFVKPIERPYRNDICINGSWAFSPVWNDKELSTDQIRNPKVSADLKWESVPLKVPSSWNINRFAYDSMGGDFITYPSYPKNWENVKAGWIKKDVQIPADWDQRVFLHFDAIAGYAVLFVNGKKVASNFENFLPWEVDITNHIQRGKSNEILLWLAHGDLLNQPGKYGRRVYVGGSFWGQHVIGPWQDVFLVKKPDVYIKNTYIKPLVDKDILEVTYTIANLTKKVQKIEVTAAVQPWLNKSDASMLSAPLTNWALGNAGLALSKTVTTINPGEEKLLTVQKKVDGKLKYWNAETPNLYAVISTLTSGSKTTDREYTRFGWRQFQVKGNQFFLNGKPIVIKGDSWHYMGVPQMTRRYAWAWYHTLKGMNATGVRLHAQPFPKFYLDMADEMGFYVLDETGIWSSDGGPKIDSEVYWDNAAEHLKRMILRDRNAPSVFGWSVCNETIPVAQHVFHAPDSLIDRQVKEINRWVAITRSLDQTRNWISGDGETGKPTDLPTTIGHYGDENSYKEWEARGLPWGVGEGGMGYYGTPKQTSKYNGEASYVSQYERMNALATEAKLLLGLQRKYNANYRSIFNIAWYALQPLPLGLKDTTKAPTLNDGIYFTAFKEGVPGMQPERLGPYTTTFNPGYDKALPLVVTWPLYDAVKESFDDSKQLELPMIPYFSKQATSAIAPVFNGVTVLSSDPENKLGVLLQKHGLNVTGKITKAARQVIVVDGKHLPQNTVMEGLAALAMGGSKIFITALSPESSGKLEQLVGGKVAVFNRNATSYIPVQKDAIVSNIAIPDLYLTELSKDPVTQYTFSVSGNNSVKKIIDAANTDWKQWNSRAEYSKTASVLRSERQQKPDGGVLMSVNKGSGQIYFTSFDLYKLNDVAQDIVHQLIENLGVQFEKGYSVFLPALNEKGVLENALLQSAGSKKDAWQLIKSKGDFFVIPPTEKGNGKWQLSYWVYSPRSLTDLLVEPDMPSLKLQFSSDKKVDLLINGKSLEQGVQNFEKPLPVEKGWNQVIVEGNADAPQKLSMKLSSNNDNFFKSIKTRVSND